MRVTVIGSGVIGVTSAWYLAEAGHEVTVIDRQPGPALETSFANAGEISPGYASPWAAPGVPAKALKWMFRTHAPLILRPRADAAMLRWLAAMLRECTAGRYAVNKARMVRLATFSHERLLALAAEQGIAFDARERGTLQLFRKQAQMDAVGKDLAILRADGVAFEVLDRAGCLAAEPGLAAATAPIAGGLRLPGDGTGDCYLFTEALANRAAARGVTFLWNHAVRPLRVEGGRIAAVETDYGPIAGDAVVVAGGSHSPALVRALGVRLPVYPVKGYSITAPITDAAHAPVSTLLDESYKVAITRLGDRVRVGGMAEVTGFDLSLDPRRRATLELSVGTLFPGAADLAGARFWAGLRPMTPDSTPVIGSTAVPGLFLNTGHGTLGWTMACGSAHVLADLVSARPPAIDATDLAISRYG